MHEKALLDDLMGRILAVSAENGGGRVIRIHVWLGALSHFTPEHFREHFLDASAGTVAEGADVVAVLDGDVADPRAAGVVLERVALAD
jgi:hydrogenase nickel incorporation protein HypA/HybF